VKGTSNEDAKAKYVESLLEVRLRYDPDALGVDSRICLQVLHASEDGTEEATKYTEELEAA
jgi:hypothetical protein